MPREAQCVGGGAQALVGHDRDRQRVVDLGEVLELGSGHGLLDEFDSGLGQPRQPGQRGGAVPPGVDVDADAGAAGELLGDRGDAGDVVGGALGSHLELEAVVQPGVELGQGLVGDDVGGLGAQGPGDGDVGTGEPAEQGVDRDTEGAGPGVVHRDLDGGLGE